MTTYAEPVPEQGSFVSANGLSVHVVEMGSGQPLILLHGAMGTAHENFAPIMPVLADHFRVIAPDSRGHGRTTNPGGELSYSLMADDVASMVKTLDLDQPVVFGWSDGGQIALDLAIRFPTVPVAIAVGGAYIRLTTQTLAELDALGIHGPGKVDFEHLIQTIPKAVESWRSLHAPQGDGHWRKLLLALSHVARNPLPYDTSDLAGIRTRALVFLGDRDQFIPVEQAVEMYRAIPMASLAIVPGADHFLRRDETTLLQLLLPFFLEDS